MKRVTQQQIADATGVSRSLVSRILSGDHPKNVSADKVKSILKTADKMGYKTPRQRKADTEQQESPSQQFDNKPSPRRGPERSRTRFGVNSQGSPLHKYGNQWRDRVAAATGVRPVGSFTDLKTGEQREVMKVLNSIDKDGKKRTKIDNEQLKLEKVSRAAWSGVAKGAAAIGIPLSLAAAFNKLEDFVSKSAQTARQGASLGINQDKLLAMARTAETFGVSQSGFTGSLRNVQRLITDYKNGVSNQLGVTLSQYGVNTDSGKLMDLAVRGRSSTRFLSELYGQYNSGKIKRPELVSLLGGLGAGSLTELFTQGKFGNVLNARGTPGTARAVEETDRAFRLLNKLLGDLVLTNLPKFESVIKDISKWLEDTDFDKLGKDISDFGQAIENALVKIGAIDSKESLMQEREDAIKSLRGLKYLSERSGIDAIYQSGKGRFEDEISIANEKLKAYGVAPVSLDSINQMTTNNAEQSSTPQQMNHSHDFTLRLDMSSYRGGDPTAIPWDMLEKTFNDQLQAYFKNEAAIARARYAR